MTTVANTVFDTRTLQRGRALQYKGAVLEMQIAPSEGGLLALVQGTQDLPYDVVVHLDEHGAVEETECSCPVGWNCKHGVAAYLEYLSTDGADIDQERQLTTTASAESISEAGGTPHRSGSDGHANPWTDKHLPPDTPERQVGDAWLTRLHATLTKDDATSPEVEFVDRNSRERIYALSSEGTTGDGSVGTSVRLTLLDAPRTAAGHFNKGRRARPDHTYWHNDIRLSSIDRDIAAVGSASIQRDYGRWSDDPGRYALNGRTGHVLFDLALQSGRCFIGNDRRTPLTRGNHRTLKLAWQAQASDSSRLIAELDGLSSWWFVASDPPYWVDPSRGEAGVIDTDLAAEQLQVVLDAPTVDTDRLQRFADALNDLPTRDTPERALPIPLPPVTLTPLIQDQPKPVMFLCSIDEDPHVDTWRLFLFMRYGSALLPCAIHDVDAITRTEDEAGNPVRIKRDLSREMQCYFELLQRASGLLPLKDMDSPELSAEFSAVGESPAERFSHYRRLVRQRNAWERDGWALVVLPPVHVDVMRPAHFDGLLQAADDAPGWFDVSLGFEVAGVHHDLLTLITSYVERGGGDEPLLIEADDGRFIEVPAEVLQPVAQTFLELGLSTQVDGRIRLSRARALALEEVDKALEIDGIETRWSGTREPFELAKQLRAFVTAKAQTLDKVTVPRGLKASLRPYQRAGLGWLNALARQDLCGILADDMGLGKTLQTLAHVLWLRQSRRLLGPVLVVAPTSLLMNWAREAAKFAPRLRVRIWHGVDRQQHPLDVDKARADLVITSYGVVLRDHEMLAEHGFDCLVLDEAQQIRNPRAKTTRAIKSLPIRRRLCLSGTPLENHLGELWSQFDFLMPGLLGDEQHFARRFRTPIERHGDQACRQRLAAALAPFVLRRRKEDVATELPPKTEIVREVTLGEAQAKLYESIRVSMQQRVREALRSKGLAQSQVTVLDALLKLRQLCCHPELLKMDSARKVGDSAKTAMLLDMVDELIAEGRRILIFSSFTSLLSIVERELGKRQHRWVKLTGQTRKRDEAIDTFQRGEVPLFLISLKAGGTGLNLTAADTVILYDPWWNPAAEAQASARTHRIGQDKPVFVYRLVTTNTVEERIVAMQQRKRELAEAMLEGGEQGALGRLSVDETLALFEG